MNEVGSPWPPFFSPGALIELLLSGFGRWKRATAGCDLKAPRDWSARGLTCLSITGTVSSRVDLAGLLRFQAWASSLLS